MVINCKTNCKEIGSKGTPVIKDFKETNKCDKSLLHGVFSLYKI